MKRAVVRQRRTDRDGTIVFCVVCPVCSHRHWVTDTDQPVRCPRKLGKNPFLIGANK